MRADAQRNIDSLLEAAKVVFASSGVDAPVKEVADKAGVGSARCTATSPSARTWSRPSSSTRWTRAPTPRPALSAAHAPTEALALWLHRLTDFLATKRGLAPALHSGDPAFDELPAYFMERFGSALGALLETAATSGEIRTDVSTKDLLYAVANLCQSAPDADADYSQRMVALLVDGLRTGRHPDRAL